jgi:hypothetical protein
MRLKMILRVFNFIQVKVVKMRVQAEDEQFSAHGLFIIM